MATLSPVDIAGVTITWSKYATSQNAIDRRFERVLSQRSIF